MSSISNNEEEFDWEAAVADIDDACNQAAMVASLYDDAFLAFVNNVDDGVSNATYRTKQDVCDIHKKQSKVIRQSTLDKFVEVNEKQSEGHQTYNPSSMPNCNNGDALYSMESIKSDIDAIAAQSWIYPVNVPLRDYQFSIVKTALFSNTLVSLPTGLGKTLIAAVVMYNYFRWFPAGKIVFTAPSRPLVMQQIEACHNIVGIPQEWTIDMTGQMNPAQRSGFWHSKRVFFVTPQVLEKDIQSGSCHTKELVCLVVDEAHRAMGNYSYCVVVREIMAVPAQLRILALTATPGSKQATIQTVIDNLHISTLEYRNEDDPDVMQYTHNKSIELIKVAMDKDSVSVSNLLLEVITPVVHRLCGLGVFYSKDVTKLTPFEFLTARDKFRQSPPAYLAQPQYGEVEAYFGAAITLYHIYKLLFSHGIRPAFEMLQQKLQQGSFARVMGRNETLWQAKSLMQQSIRHGAPNQKILKMKEIIINHFQSKDHVNSRIIIFTNFRESVKDIMESLALLGEVVKAMEFIGQSSGKASKGQSQKVQQAVLKRFRAGGYNTIVATSIGEEGLDIMEVDLVICFDANVSPLRMIQRMGRTGRKRDGRVVILASEGSELQGYLKKQAKAKAVGKHMHNGGINSFNFHSSPRMVPHSYQPKVDFVEMSIEKFVHRGRKSRGDAVSSDPGCDELSELEMNSLGKYFGPGVEKQWKPSLISFPHCQLFPSQVYCVKHSFRTTEMLIDTLQSLQEHREPLTCSRNRLLNDEVGTSSLVCLQHEWDEANEAELQGTRDDITVPLDTVLEQNFHPCSPSAPFDKAVNGSQGLLHERSASPSNFFERDDLSEYDKYPSSPSSEHFYEGHESLAKHGSPSREVPKQKPSMAILQDKETELTFTSSSKTSLHRCLFSTGFVSVSPNGRVLISSPPTLPLLNKLSTYAPFLSANNSKEPLETHSPQHIEGRTTHRCTTSEVFKVGTPLNGVKEFDLPEKIKVNGPESNLAHMIGSLEQIKVSKPPCSRENSSDSEGDPQTPPCSIKLFGNTEEVVLATPESCFANLPHASKGSILEPVSNADASYMDFSPYLMTLAENGIVPESPIPVISKDDHVTIKSLQQSVSDLANETTKKCNTSAFGIVTSSWEEAVTYLHEKGTTDRAVSNGKEACETPEENKFAAPADVSPEALKSGLNSGNMKIKGLEKNFLHDSAQKLSFECSVSKSAALKEHCATPVNGMSNSNEDWHLSSADAKSIQKPRRFKRLCKYKDCGKAQISASYSEISPKRNKKLDKTNAKRHSKISVHPFIDEEAEVSSDERVSTDEDDENESNEEPSQSDSFIDDEVELTAASTQQGGQLDMMAVYRRSLLTQSPFPQFHPKGRLQHSRPYCGNEISEQRKANNTSADASDVKILGHSSLASPMHDDEDSRTIDLDSCSRGKEQLNIARKTNFSIWQGKPTEKSKAVDNEELSSAIRNLTEDFDSSSIQNDVIGDDDLFEGLDLDAFEAEATEMARSRSNTNASGGAAFLKEATDIQFAKRNSEQGICISNQGNSNASEAVNDIEMDFLCTPTFDLGI